MSIAFKRPTNISLFFTIFILITVFITFLCVMYFLNKQIVIETKTGKMIGTTVNRFGKKVYCYFGVPYAEPPIGELRFRRPQPKKPWKEVLKASKQPNYCWQRNGNVVRSSFAKKKMGSSISNIVDSVPDWQQFYETGMSEDCLYLNIYVPNFEESKPNMTVMVWIHGGSFQSGSISIIGYDGSILAAKTGVIVVALNYRLGIFGFLTAENSELTGNYGLYDQLMALQWINQNIQSFGGNPNNVVLFGESAGAISVGYHLVSPLSQDLFSRAILQSGNPVVPLMALPTKMHTKAAIEVVRLSNCPINSDNGTDTLDESSVGCLQRKNSSLLFELSKVAFPNKRGAFLPITDGHFFLEHPHDLVKKRVFFKQKEIMIGTNSDEGATFAGYGPFKKFWVNDKIDPNFTKDNIAKILNNTLPEKFQDLIKDAVDYAFDNLSDDCDPIQVWGRFTKIVGDIIFVCSDYVFINEYSSTNRSVYYYQFRPKSEHTFGPKWATGAVHADEIAYVFGIPLIYKGNFTVQQIELSKKMVNVWSNFAKTGKPDCCDSWPQYRYEEPLFMSFDVKQNDDREIHMKQGFPGYKCNDYYEELISALRKYFENGNEIPA